MPYQLGSPWNDPPTEEQLKAIRGLWHRLGYDYTEADMPDSKWRARDLQYELLGKVRMKGQLKGNPGAVLREQGESVHKRYSIEEFSKPGKLRTDYTWCDENLLEFRNQLKAQIQDEHDANKMYGEFSAKFMDLKLPTWEVALKSIAQDEGNHAGILEIIVDVITEKCGE